MNAQTHLESKEIRIKYKKKNQFSIMHHLLQIAVNVKLFS